MNKQLIQKVIKSNDTSACPELTYDNPLLDRTVAEALAKSFVKILRVSQQNSNINNNLRHSVLTNIRKICRNTPNNHLETGDTITNLLTEVYCEKASKPQLNKIVDPVEKRLDDFIVRKLKDLDVNSNYQSSFKAEVAQSLINLNKKSIQSITQNILGVSGEEKKNLCLVKDLWRRTECDSFTNNICDISIRMKPEIEKLLLDYCLTLLIKQTVNLNELFCSKLTDLVQKCSISPECFQICCGILNCLFITINFNPTIQGFISEFVRQVAEKCSETISVLYPVNLSNIAVLLDFDLTILPDEMRSSYIQNTLPYLKKLHLRSESDFTLVLSHYPQWFDVYFDD